jgi:hypothetical protein
MIVKNTQDQSWAYLSIVTFNDSHNFSVDVTFFGSGDGEGRAGKPEVDPRHYRPQACHILLVTRKNEATLVI